MSYTYPVTIVVPIYKEHMSASEQVSLDRLRRVLGHYRTVIIKPESLDLSKIHSLYPGMETENFDDGYFKGIAGYNRLMLSPEFYSRFSDSEYILIYQLDAYVFRDELSYWCSLGYDYIGAPWLMRPMYRFPLFRLTSWIKKRYCEATGRPNGQITRFKVGNGGLSLRKTASHLRAVTELEDTVRQFLEARHHHTFNEDVFFGVEVNRHGIGFKYPEWREALRFSFDTKPDLCIRYTDYRLPFGCHGWTKRKTRRFWSSVIPSRPDKI
ncbi:MAG TPA: hypothetical protein IAC04_03010 [Candidatus Coprenecus stercoravium]|uniref:DUF5672 domain-containing protein n=1 Tax=Candidatus Coprenecus stercoravium TaxID=2840735 RepID=A0A9D2GQ93_9BACT|nr:hypothetical protein [Candidatus Coprenecus stercoravium]